MEREQRVQHGRHSHQGEQRRRDAANSISEVQQSDGKAAEDDGEVEPREKGAFIGEEDFWFHAGGERDAFP